MALINPSVTDFKDYFTRDFPYGTNANTSILDSDISKAFLFVNPVINANLFSDQSTYTLAYLLLAAHYLVVNMRASSQGITGQYNFLQAGKGVGSVSESFAIPEYVMANPTLAMYCKTNYGAQYVQMIIPLLVGQMYVVCGGTNA